MTVLQYSFLGSLLKRCILFENVLQFSLPPPYTKLKLEKILDTRVQYCLRGEGSGWTWVSWQTPQKCKNVPRLRISNLTISADLHGLLAPEEFLHLKNYRPCCQKHSLWTSQDLTTLLYLKIFGNFICERPRQPPKHNSEILINAEVNIYFNSWLTKFSLNNRQASKLLPHWDPLSKLTGENAVS